LRSSSGLRGPLPAGCPSPEVSVSARARTGALRLRDLSVVLGIVFPSSSLRMVQKSLTRGQTNDLAQRNNCWASSFGVFVGSPVQLQAEPRRRSKYQYHDLASSNKSKGRKSLRGHKALNDFPGKCRPLRTRKNNGLILFTRSRLPRFRLWTAAPANARRLRASEN
jgi:hypothetical protein